MSRTLINNLPDSYVCYELSCRGKIPLLFSMSERKLVLFDALNLEREGGASSAIMSRIPVKDDLKECEKHINKLIAAFNSNKIGEVEKTGDCLTFLIQRIRNVMATEEPDLVNKDNILLLALDLQEKVSDVVIALSNELTPSFDMSSALLNVSLSNSQRQHTLHSSGSSQASSLPRVQQEIVNDRGCNHLGNRVKVPVYKWGLKFSGRYEKDRMTPTEFVSRTLDYMSSRNVSEIELYSSAIDLFEGVAYQWFKSLGNLGDEYPRNWTELSGRLLSDFERPDYLHDLEEHIRNRKQKSNESIVEFFAYIEGAFLRLHRPVSQAEQIRILRRNIDSRYKQSLIFEVFTKVEHLKRACKKLEELEFQKRRDVETKHVRFSPSSHFAQFENYEEPSTFNKNQSFEGTYHRNNMYPNSKVRTRSPSPGDVRADSRWNSTNNVSRYNRSNESYNRPNQSYSYRGSNFNIDSRNRSSENNSYYNHRQNTNTLNQLNNNRERGCEKCELVGTHERFCPNKLNDSGTTRPRSPVVPTTDLTNGHQDI